MADRPLVRPPKPKKAKLVRLPDGGKTYEYKFQVKNVTYRGSTGCTDQPSAYAFAFALKQREKAKAVLRAVATGQVPHVPHDGTFGFVAGEFWRLRGSRVVNVQGDLHYLRMITGLIGKSTPMSQVNDLAILELLAKLDDYRTPRTGEKYKPNSINQILRMVQRVYAFAGSGKKGVLKMPLPAIDWAEYRLPATQRERELSPEEEYQMCACKRTDHTIVLRFGLVTGLRKTALTMLRWDQIDFRLGEIRIIQRKGATKTVRYHVIHMTKWMYETLKAQLPFKDAAKGQVWTTVRPRGVRAPMTSGAFSSWFQRRAKALGYDLRIHDLRRSTGGRILEATNSIACAQAVLGHSSPIITAKVYAKSRKTNLVAAMSAAELLNRRNTDEISFGDPNRNVSPMGYEMR